MDANIWADPAFQAFLKEQEEAENREKETEAARGRRPKKKDDVEGRATRMRNRTLSRSQSRERPPSRGPAIIDVPQRAPFSHRAGDYLTDHKSR